MKKLTLIAITAIAALAMSYRAQASVTLEFGVGDLYNSSSNILSAGIAVVVADSSGLGAAGLDGALSATQHLAAGSLIGGGSGDEVLGAGVYDITASSGQPGYFGGVVNGQALASPIAAGQKVFVVFFPSLGDSATTVGQGTSYGVSSNPGTDLEGGAAWVLPPDGATVALNNFDSNEGGSYAPMSNGNLAIYTTPVPEPSSIALVLIGLFGAVGLVRRRS